MNNRINIRIDPKTDEILTYIAGKKRQPKAVIAREYLVDAVNEKAMEYFLSEYKGGRMSFKEIISISDYTPQAIMYKISQAGLEPHISEASDHYTEKNYEKITQKLKQGELSWKTRIEKHPINPEDEITEFELNE